MYPTVSAKKTQIEDRRTEAHDEDNRNLNG